MCAGYGGACPLKTRAHTSAVSMFVTPAHKRVRAAFSSFFSSAGEGDGQGVAGSDRGPQWSPGIRVRSAQSSSLQRAPTQAGASAAPHQVRKARQVLSGQASQDQH